MEEEEDTRTAFVLVPTMSVSAEIRAWVARNVRTRQPRPIMYAVRISGETHDEALANAGEIVDLVWGPDLRLMADRGGTNDHRLNTLMEAGLVTPGWHVESHYLGYSREIKGQRVLVVDLGNVLNRMSGEALCFAPNTRAAAAFAPPDTRPAAHPAPEDTMSPEEVEKLLAILRQMYGHNEVDQAGENGRWRPAVLLRNGVTMKMTDETMTPMQLVSFAWWEIQPALGDLGKILASDPYMMEKVAHTWQHLDAADDLLSEALRFTPDSGAPVQDTDPGTDPDASADGNAIATGDLDDQGG